MSTFRTVEQAKLYLDVKDEEFQQLVELGILEPVDLGGRVVVFDTQLTQAKKWLDRQQLNRPFFVVTNIMGRLARLERQVAALIQTLQPPVTVSVDELEDAQLKDLLFDVVEAGSRDQFVVPDALYLLGVISALSWQAVKRAERLGFAPGWKPFAEALLAIEGWQARNKELRQQERQLLTFYIKRGRDNLSFLMTTAAGLSATKILHQHPRRTVAAYLNAE